MVCFLPDGETFYRPSANLFGSHPCHRAGSSRSLDFLRRSVYKKSAVLDAGGYIVADESCRTSIEGVFVAGDVRTKTLRQVVTAVSDGAIAADGAEQYVILSK